MATSNNSIMSISDTYELYWSQIWLTFQRQPIFSICWLNSASFCKRFALPLKKRAIIPWLLPRVRLDLVLPRRSPFRLRFELWPERASASENVMTRYCCIGCLWTWPYPGRAEKATVSRSDARANGGMGAELSPLHESVRGRKRIAMTFDWMPFSFGFHDQRNAPISVRSQCR